jgi:23S rRNA (uracil1939-C5)-methyltransferase
VTLSATGLDIDITGVEAKSGGLSADARVQLAERAARPTSPASPWPARPPTWRACRRCAWARPSSPCRRAPSCRPPAAPRPPWPTSSPRPPPARARIADLYCGVGTFTFRLAEIAPVHAADSAPEAWRPDRGAGRRARPQGRHRRARDLARRRCWPTTCATPTSPSSTRRAPAPWNRPRAGRLGVARVIGVSCNPATFARDARVLIDAGFRLERVLPVDQFLWSPQWSWWGVHP